MASEQSIGQHESAPAIAHQFPVRRMMDIQIINGNFIDPDTIGECHTFSIVPAAWDEVEKVDPEVRFAGHLLEEMVVHDSRPTSERRKLIVEHQDTNTTISLSHDEPRRAGAA